MTDSPFLDPNDPHYSDTPSVDEHPLEGGGPFDALLHPEGYLLVSEAELAEAMGHESFFVRVEYANGEEAVELQTSERYAAAIFAALAKQQEDRNA